MFGSESKGRAINLRNFSAHKKQVLCSKIGRKSGQIVATGGEDALVKLWHVANDDPLMSLAGHKTNIIKNFSRWTSFSGHLRGLSPFASEYFATGSLDTNVKVWDSRVKKDVQSHRGESENYKEPISSLRFTPDGKWIVAGGEDGTIKIYDITTGKKFGQIQSHRSTVTTIDFHPSEFYLATGSADRTVQVLSLEDSIEVVSKSDIFPSGVKSVQFSPEDGSVLLSICDEGMKVHAWNSANMRCIDTIDAKWGDINDVNLHQGLNQIFAVSANPTVTGYVGIWVIPVDSVRPWYNGQDDKKMHFSPQLTKEMVNETLNSSTEDVLNEIRNRKPVSVATTTTTRGEVITVTKVSGERRTPALGVPQTPSSEVIVSSKRKEPANIDIDSFVPKGEAFSELDDDQIIEEIMKSHQKMSSAMTNRLNNLKIVRRIWIDQGDPKEAIKALVKMKDLPLASDMLGQLLRPECKKHLTLELCALLLPVIIDLIKENYEEHISTALKASMLLYSSFSGMIEENLQLFNSNSNLAQMDINAEARISKCQACKRGFGEVKRIIIERAADFSQMTDLALLSRRVVKTIK
ncbi:hypothetical protein FDP41_012964 [Naegleria fowleri]|uniref:Katanin p80 subunit C-terminal domain-containing protein n=1 Tax=Naegleria fowleri TaxID=5763 RepID=A0A6A5C0F3_NAEFO|nr:uncharacterized protein FDP41_012964 [Naegleria fowleri]KAF0981176.1 hypothetical protein FDP41_012964 [Naegleria fowleri]